MSDCCEPESPCSLRHNWLIIETIPGIPVRLICVQCGASYAIVPYDDLVN